jgi:hypothetical protein
MKYADEQITRPQHENGCDYGHGRRSVLVQNGKQQILHIGNAKHWGGIGAGRYGSSVEIVAYPVKDATCRQKTLYPTDEDKKALEVQAKAVGKEVRVTIGMKQWEQIATRMFEHLGMGFDLKLISLKHTLLLDVEGEIDGPPPPDASKPKKVHPRIESDKLYRIFQEEGKCKLAEANIIKQGGGKITYKLPTGREIEKRTKDILEEGGGGTVDEAVAGYLRHYQEQLAAGADRLHRAAESYAYYKDNLSDAEHKIEDMLKELL